MNNVKWIQTILYLCGVGHRTSPPVSKYHISSHLLYNPKNIILPEAKMAKQLLIGVPFQWVHTISENCGNVDFTVLTGLIVAAIFGGLQ